MVYIVVIEGNTAPTALCSPGYHCTEYANNSTPDDGVTGDICTAGRFCLEGSVTGEDCPLGTFSNREGLTNETSCDDCTPGYFCASTGLTTETGECYAGNVCTEFFSVLEF